MLIAFESTVSDASYAGMSSLCAAFVPLQVYIYLGFVLFTGDRRPRSSLIDARNVGIVNREQTGSHDENPKRGKGS